MTSVKCVLRKAFSVYQSEPKVVSRTKVALMSLDN